MRLDLFLKLSRLHPRRGGAKDLCDAGDVSVNGLTAKAGREVKVGDRIGVRLPSRELVAEVLEIPSGRSVSRDRARALTKIVEEKRFDLWGKEVPRRRPGGGTDGSGTKGEPGSGA